MVTYMKAKRWIMWALVVLFFAALLVNVGIELSYAQNKARNPNAAKAEVIKLTINHGSEIYVSERELNVYTGTKSVTILVMLVSFAGAGLMKAFIPSLQDAPGSTAPPRRTT